MTLLSSSSAFVPVFRSRALRERRLALTVGASLASSGGASRPQRSTPCRSAIGPRGAGSHWTAAACPKAPRPADEARSHVALLSSQVTLQSMTTSSSHQACDVHRCPPASGRPWVDFHRRPECCQPDHWLLLPCLTFCRCHRSSCFIRQIKGTLGAEAVGHLSIEPKWLCHSYTPPRA